jgi:DNA-binding PadR family transcriptional regulator
MANRKSGKRAIFERLAIPDAILQMIPADGSCIQYKKLDELREQKHIGVGTMNETLKEFEEKGLIRKEPIKLSHGAGTCYRRTIPLPKLDELGWSAFIRENKRRIEMIENSNETEETETLYLSRALENYVSIIFRTLKVANKMKRDKMNPEAVEAFIDAAGKTYITGLLKDINSLTTGGSEALEIVRAAFGHPEFKLNEARTAVHERRDKVKRKEGSSNSDLSESDYCFKTEEGEDKW